MRHVGSGLAKLAVDGHRAEVVLNRPDKRNAMNEQLMRDLRMAVEAADDAEDTRVILLRGEGPVFCAGMDLHMMRQRHEPRRGSERASGEREDERSESSERGAGGAREPSEPRAGAGSEIERDVFPSLLDAIESTSAPTVAAIKRAAPAGAFELTLPCDFRVLGSEAKYGVLEVTLGTFPHGGATQRLPRLVGLGKAKELVLTGEFVDPEEARQMGLVNEVVPDEEVEDRARALADSLAENAPLGMARAKTALNAALEMPLAEGLEYERSLGRELDDSRDYREGFEARIEEREPQFEGR